MAEQSPNHNTRDKHTRPAYKGKFFSLQGIQPFHRYKFSFTRSMVIIEAMCSAILFKTLNGEYGSQRFAVTGAFFTSLFAAQTICTEFTPSM